MTQKSNAAAARQAEAENVGTTARLPKPLKPDQLRWNFQGAMVWREGQIILGPDHTMADLHEHPTRLFQNLQQNRDTALHRGDCLRVYPHDRSWMLRNVIVQNADPQNVKLAWRREDKLDLEDLAADVKWSDGTVEIRWHGQGYAVLRIGDGVQMVPGFFPDPESAINAWQRSKTVVYE